MASTNMLSTHTALSNLTYVSFLSAYPHPAFILRSRNLAGKSGPSLDPIFGNSAFRALLFGPDAEMSEMALGTAFLRALVTVERCRAFTDWLEQGSTPLGKNNGETLLIEIRLSWTTLDAPPVRLDFTQTHLDDFIVCTTTPRSPLPRLAPKPNAPMGMRTSRLRRERDVSMQLSDFPQASQLYMTPSSSATPTPFSSIMRTIIPANSEGGSGESAPSSRSPERMQPEIFSSSLTSPGGMRQMVENHDWHETPLGPRSAWPASLKAAVSYVLASPYPVRALHLS